MSSNTLVGPGQAEQEFQQTIGRTTASEPTVKERLVFAPVVIVQLEPGTNVSCPVQAL